MKKLSMDELNRISVDEFKEAEKTPLTVVLDNVRRYTRNGSIIVFHDSLRSVENLKYALPKAIEWLQEQGYEFRTLG